MDLQTLSEEIMQRLHNDLEVFPIAEPFSGYGPSPAMIVFGHINLPFSAIDEKLLHIIDKACGLANQLKLKSISEALFLVALWDMQRNYFSGILDACYVQRDEFLSKIAACLNSEEHASIFQEDMSVSLKEHFLKSFGAVQGVSNGKVLISDILKQIARSESVMGVLFRNNGITIEKINESSTF